MVTGLEKHAIALVWSFQHALFNVKNKITIGGIGLVAGPMILVRLSLQIDLIDMIRAPDTLDAFLSDARADVARIKEIHGW